MKGFLKIWFVVAAWFIVTGVSGSNTAQLNQKFVIYFLSGDMTGWKQTVDSLRQTRLDAATELVLLYGEYGLIGNYLGAKQMELAEAELPFFEARIDKALKRQPNDATLHAFSAALIAYKIALQPWKAPFYSRSHSENLRKAIQFGGNLGLPLVEQGNSLYFRPSLFGGDKQASVAFYERAFEYYRHRERQHWMYYNVGAWLAQVYVRQGNKRKAEMLYLQLLKEAPGFKWVKDDLLPALRAGKNGPDYFSGQETQK